MSVKTCGLLCPVVEPESLDCTILYVSNFQNYEVASENL